MNTTVEPNAKTHIHIFEQAELGVAPFKIVEEYDRGKGNLTNCDYCKAAIRYEQIIEDANGHTFKVGSECVEKTDDTGLISRMRMEIKKRSFKAAAKEYNRKEEEYKAKLAQQREKNGGLTDQELEEISKAKREAEKRAAQRRDALIANHRILSIWAPLAEEHRRYMAQKFGHELSKSEPYGNSGFMAGMWATLQIRPYTELTQRQRETLARAIAKDLARSNGKRNIDPFLAEARKALGL